ncbi:helix-turn-helix transcriptional regulator [Streptomyces sp. MBT56]|uniref:helix-turn-helix domain-containing protein n=1 Tax=unclassified Streptomyces TaxID=2593676 RepID=UPI001909FF60|nr:MULTISPECIES: helix-turn-helix transcriptional regulator [unclassified Streptomyces]MBK3533621.1 helix-turn-helix transcriptional regulator [Streptomyces sp. MBT72]MBK3538104.1 helix-turn-helix transcriptional regulator [Streptomyces sp. MBT67]MBK3552258.1 helix-turn-helix transcriptional regulator [Streptomyces sp. MBT61]MBK3560300.1 helix-turn-helix transcriptional regulator [Streptomyces sp. MBT56]MBK3599966.1 helix-turn-helix transcriptional regulator [Streptomyces sp. MBT54]
MAWKRNPAPKSVYRRQLSARLKELREAADLTMSEVAKTVEINQGTLSRIESGDRGTSPVVVKAMLDCYGVSDTAVREDLLDLVRADQAQKQKWWRKYSAVINTTQYGGYLELEASATSLRSYEPQLIPGLLQTADYARKVITSMRMDLDAKQIEALVTVRMNRQALLDAENAPKLWAVIDEAAIRRMSGSPAVLKGQLERLLELEPRTNITLQLLPFDAGFHPGLYGSFMLMGFPEPNPDVVWVENLTNSVYFEGSDDVGRYTEVFDHLRATALGPPETRSRIKNMIKEL